MKIEVRLFEIAIVALGLAFCSAKNGKPLEPNERNGGPGKTRALSNAEQLKAAASLLTESLDEDGEFSTGSNSAVSYDENTDFDSVEDAIPPIISNVSTISNYYKYQTQHWPQRNLKGWSSLDLVEFDDALTTASSILCNQGITATLFDDQGEQVYQKTVGSDYASFSGYLNYSIPADGWTGDTTFAAYSNSKGLAATTFLAAIVDTGLGYLDEPIQTSFPEFLTEFDIVGRVTPRMILSHTSGMAGYNRNDPDSDYYSCLYDETTELVDCLEEFMLSDDTLQHEPGSKAKYTNEPFDVLAEVMVRKTGLANFGEVFEKYITGPLGMDGVSYDCPVVQSTSEKPHVAWGACVTAHDMAKWVQMLSKNGYAQGGTQVLSEYGINQMMTMQTGRATNGDETIILGLEQWTMTRCYQRLGKPENFYLSSSLMGYGLGSMFWPGTKGQLIAHAGSVGGLWVLAPGRYSAYFGWMHNPGEGFYGSAAYAVIASILDFFELSSTFMVSNSHRDLDDYEELKVCGETMFIDLWSFYGVDNIFESPVPVVPPPPADCDLGIGKRRAQEDEPRLLPHMENVAAILREEL